MQSAFSSFSVPTFSMLVPGPWEKPDDVVTLLCRAGILAVVAGSELKRGEVGVEVIEDAHLAAAFEQGRSGSLSVDILHTVSEFGRAALLEVARRLDEDPSQTAAIGRELRKGGGSAIRMEGSGAAAEWNSWLENMESGSPFGLYDCSTMLVSDGEGTVFTCGMHQFDLPDAEISIANSNDAVRWLDEFCCFQLTEGPAIGTGHTFRPDPESQPRKLERWPDHRHHPNDGRHNPFGVWRLLQAAEDSLDAIDPVPMITPSLVAQLLAAEKQKGSQLTQLEVERLVEKAPAISMELADAIAVERSRGYADLEPRRAWPQWLLVRESF